jgi:hypothetical protein
MPTTTQPRLLFPDLPPELRNEIYTYLSTSTPTTTSLPLKLKTFSCRHTTIQICPVHYGSTNLLSLSHYNFNESHEYASWLRQNGLQLKIGIIFKGRVNTFVQRDWDKKISAHLRKLVKIYPWLEKVAQYDVRVKWDPMDGALKSKGGKRVAGEIVRDMLAMLMRGMMQADVRKKKGDVKVKLGIGHRIAVESVVAGARFGLAEVLSVGGDEVRSKTWEVWKEECKNIAQIEESPRFVPVLQAKQEEKHLLDVERGVVTWADSVKEQLVVRKRVEQGELTDLVAGQVDEKSGYIFNALVDECLERR